MASSIATQVALHCIICYEEFDLKNHQPVVLPCGHTYVCIVCAKRLKKCMECREPLYWNPPKPVPPPGQYYNHNQYNQYGRSPGHTRYHAASAARGPRIGRYSPGTTTTTTLTDPQTPPHPSMTATSSTTTPHTTPGGGGPENNKKEEIQLPLPKNVVLMEMIEAKERQQRLLREAKRREQEESYQREQEKRLQKLQEQLENSERHEQQDGLSANNSNDNSMKGKQEPAGTNLVDDDDTDEEDEEEEEPLLDPALSGMAAFSGSCGTYAVKDPLGLVVLPHDPNRQRHNSNVKEEEDEKKEQTLDDYYTISGSGSGESKDDLLRSVSTISTAAPVPAPAPDAVAAAVNTSQPSATRVPFTIQEGQKVQVVGVEEGVYQLARGGGYIVATVNQLVKVGGPLETSCKLEGMLQSVERKQREVQKQLEEINKLARGLHEKIVLEQSQPEEHPVISLSLNQIAAIEEQKQLEEQQQQQLISVNDSSNPLSTVFDESQPSTPTKAYNDSNSSPVGGSAGGRSTRSNDSTVVELGAPRTPGPPNNSAGPFLEMDQGSGSHSYAYDNQYVNSPAHSCPMPTNQTSALDQPFIDGTPAGLPRYRVNSDDDMYGLGWAGALGCGSTLFGERLLESSRHGASSILNAQGNDILALSFDEHSLLDNTSARNRAAALAASAGPPIATANTGSQDSPLRSGGSFDGVNFRTGMSGHRGLSQPKRERNVHHNGMLHGSSASLPRRQIRMMSEHRGVAAVRGSGGTLKRRSTPDTIVGCHDY